MRRRFGSRFGADDRLSEQPMHALLDVVSIPNRRTISNPLVLITQRMVWAITLVMLVAVIVYVDGEEGYSEPLTFLDAVYYASVTMATVGYGDITPVTETTRFISIVLVTPLRLVFLVLLVGTTLSVLTEDSRKTLRIQRWRKTVRNHTIVVGYGTMGRSAVAALLADGVKPSDIVVIDTDPAVLKRADANGLVTVKGSATRSEVLKLAAVNRARSVVVATNQDDTAVLITLSARELAPGTMIVVSAREAENQHLLEQSGADSVVISSETAGRLLGLATVTPSVVEMMEDLLSPDEGFSVAERPVGEDEVGANPRTLADIVLGVVRSGDLYRIDSPEAEIAEPGDRLLYVRRVFSEEVDK